MKFNYLIASSYDREKLIAEIYYGDDYLAEINQEHAHPELLLFGTDAYPLDDFVSILEESCIALTGKTNEIKNKDFNIMIDKEGLATIYYKGNHLANVFKEIIWFGKDYYPIDGFVKILQKARKSLIGS